MEMSANNKTQYPPIHISWDVIVDHFLMLARNVFEKGDKKAFFDAGTADVKLKDYSKEEQKKIKKSRMVEGCKRRWWELLLLDALCLYYEGNNGKDYKDDKLQKIQKQHESLSSPKGQGKPRRSFNQHLALQLSVWNAFCEALADPQYEGIFDGELPTILVSGVKDLQYTSFKLLKTRLMGEHSDQLAASNTVPADKPSHVVTSTSSALDDGERGGESNEGSDHASGSGEAGDSNGVKDDRDDKSTSGTKKNLPGVLKKTTTYVKAISGERWLQKLENLTDSKTNLENIVIGYVRATVDLLRKHHPAQRTPFMESIQSKRSYRPGTMTASLKGGKGKGKGKGKRKKKDRRRRHKFYDSSDEDEEEEEQPYDDDEDEDYGAEFRNPSHRHDPESMEESNAGDDQYPYAPAMKVRSRPAAKRPRLLSDYIAGVDWSSAAYEAGYSIDNPGVVKMEQDPSMPEQVVVAPQSSLSSGTTMNVVEKPQLSLMHPWDCDMYSTQQLDYHHGNLAQLTGQLDASHDVISMGFSPFARDSVSVTVIPEQQQQQQQEQQPLSFVAMQTQYIASLEEKMTARDQVTVTLFGDKRRAEDENAMDYQPVA